MKTEKKYSNVNAIIFIIFIGSIIYFNSLDNPFAFDDYSSIINNEDIKKSTIFSDFNRPRYIAVITLALNYRISELSTLSYHIFNTIIHIINAILVYYLINLIINILWSQTGTTIHPAISIITSLLFLTHPVQTQAVTYIVQRMASLATLFALASIFYYLKFRNLKKTKSLYCILSLIFCLLAYKTKENTITLPLLLLMLELILLKNISKIKTKIFYLLPYLILTIVIPLSFINLNTPLSDLFSDLSQISAQTQTIPRTQYLLTEFQVITTYTRLLLFPINQTIDYYYPLSNSFFELKTFLSFILIILLLTTSFILIKKHPCVSIGLFWFFIFLLVESSIIPIRDVIFEHRLYLPSIGFFFSFTYIILYIADKYKFEKLALAFFIIVIIVLCASTYYRNVIWGDEVALWQDAMNKFPQNARAISNLGTALARNNLCKEAIEQLQKALTLNDKDPNTWYNLAFCYKKLKLPYQAITAYKKVLELKPDYQKASVDIAMIYIAQRRNIEAYNVLIEAIKYHPEHPYNNALLANALCEMGNIEKSIIDFEKAVLIGLDYPDIFFNYAICLLEHNKIQESRKNLFRAVRLNPKDIEAMYFIGLTYFQEKDYEKSKYYFNIYLENSPKGRWVPDIKNKLLLINNNVK